MATGFRRLSPPEHRDKAALTVDIFENGGLTLRHVFYGNTLAEARQIERAHARSDSFYKSAVGDRDFKGIKLSTKKYAKGGSGR